MKCLVVFLGLLIVLTACDRGSSTSPSASSTSFVLSGTLREADATGIGGATVLVAGVTINPRTTTSGSDGTYRFEGLAGRVTLRVTKDGYHEISREIVLSSNHVFDLKLDRLGRLISGEVYRGIVDAPPCDPSGWDAAALCQRIQYIPMETGVVTIHLEWTGPSDLDLMFAGDHWPGVNRTIDASAHVEGGHAYEIRLNAYYGAVPFELRAELHRE
jgi:hypothetical protein